MSEYTVKDLAESAGVSRRTLHFYDERGLLKPAKVGENGYRYYDEGSLIRLQQILFYREMDLELEEIKRILDDPNFDSISALQRHRDSMQDRIARLKKLTQTIDGTLQHLMGEVRMSKKNIFEGFEKEHKEKYEQQAIDQWGDTARKSQQLWESYSDERKQEIMQEGSDIYQGIAENMDKGANSKEVQTLLAQWHENLRNFYEPSIETLGGLGEMYDDHHDFNAKFAAIHPDLPGFLKEAVAVYVDKLETEWLEKELETEQK
jgi:DNA-binding transcriptional MerR regulator